METTTLEHYIKKAQAKRSSILNTSDRGKSAYALASMALEHGSASAEAAASLLLAMEYGKAFDFVKLLSFDTENRAHADLVLMGYQPHHLWPSAWMDEAGYHGQDVMDTLLDKWGIA
ncbi:hypothetical protein [Endozoicomonas sp. ALC020]|uniref:hypothetical protein n=1 Tax=unclassified Endozoicomonas TaxID=2644528 RepID=UPI003BB1497F